MTATATAPEIRYKPGAYLLHFCTPLGDPTRPRCCARHYCGSSKSVAFRLTQHARNEGFGHIVHVANDRGIPWIVVRVEYTDTIAEAVAIERRWKRNGHHETRCPLCKENHTA